MARNEQVYELAQEWIRWLDSRRFLGEPAQKNILAMLMKDENRRPARGEPDGPMSAEMAAFNLAVSSLPVGQFVPFVVRYCGYKPKPIKTIAYELGIQPPAFYERADNAALHVHSLMRKLVELNGMLRREIEDYVD